MVTFNREKADGNAYLQNVTGKLYDRFRINRLTDHDGNEVALFRIRLDEPCEQYNQHLCTAKQVRG